MTVLILSTRNAHKVEEIRGMLSDAFAFRTLNDFPGAPAVVEDAGAFGGNATKKAVELARWLASSPRLLSAAGVKPGSPGANVFVLADDSGLEVDALGGAPGVNSARFAALDSGAPGNAPDAANNAKLIRLLENVPEEQRAARFRCVIALTPVFAPSPSNASPACAADEFEQATQLFEGACEGRIQTVARGAKGFGYDPLFIPRGFDLSFAELGDAVKNRISHRAQALGKLREFFARQNTR